MGLFDAYHEWSMKYLAIAHPMDPNRDMNLFINYGTPWMPVVAVVGYLILVFTLPSLLKKFNVPKLQLRAIGALWNLSLSIFSLLVFLGAGSFYLQLLRDYTLLDTFCAIGPEWEWVLSKPHSVLFWTFVFALSKYAELFDTVILILRQKPVGFLHWYHHSTVLLYTWFAEYTHLATGYLFIVLNAFVHTGMYFYFFLSEIGRKPSEKIALVITILQISQMVVGITILTSYATLWVVRGVPCNCSHPFTMFAAGVAMYGSYLVLFLQFFIKRYFGKKPSSTAGKPASTTKKSASPRPKKD